MNDTRFRPTEQQREIIIHDGAAFISACPGAGKTRVLAERARRVLAKMPTGRGIAFLSFTGAAVFELGTRLRQDRILMSPVFPSFLGTFDTFVWRFLIAPFGVTGSTVRPRQIADMDTLSVRPFNNAHSLSLSCFDTTTHTILPEAAKKKGFDVLRKSAGQVKAYEKSAKRLRAALRERGHLTFDEGRDEAIRRLRDAR